MECRGSNPCPENASNLKIRVLYADTDRMGVVYHGTYFRWFEAGRANYMRLRGTRYSAIEQRGIFLPIVEAHAEYLSPAAYDEVLDVSAWISDIGRAQLKFSYLISRDGKELVRGYTRHAAVNGEGKPVRLPAEIPKALVGPEIETADSPAL
jgi:acyl-CoA thioester hydrolase